LALLLQNTVAVRIEKLFLEVAPTTLATLFPYGLEV